MRNLRNINSSCTQPNYTQRDLLAGQLLQLKSDLIEAENTFNLATNNTDRGGLTPRTGNYWFSKYPNYLQSLPIDRSAYYRLPVWLYEVVQTTQGVIELLKENITKVEDKILQENRTLDVVQQQYETCLNTPVVVENDSLNLNTNNYRYEPTYMADVETPDKNKNMLLYLAGAGLVVYLVTKKKKKKK